MSGAFAELIAKLEAASEGSGCILWPRALDDRGRGRIWRDGKLMIASRWAWERVRGPIPEGMLACHKCDNPTCVNPWHLYLGTHADNMRDMKERDRTTAARYPELAKTLGQRVGLSNTWARGINNPKAKLTARQVEAIRNDQRPTRFLAAEYSVNRTTIQRIRRGIQWTI